MHFYFSLFISKIMHDDLPSVLLMQCNNFFAFNIDKSFNIDVTISLQLSQTVDADKNIVANILSILLQMKTKHEIYEKIFLTHNRDDNDVDLSRYLYR